MKRLNILLLFFLATGNLWCQPYKLVRPEYTSVFKASSTSYYTIRIDSIIVSGSDTIYYNMRNINSVAGYVNTYSILYDNFSGIKIIETDSGSTFLCRSSGDTLLLKLNSLIGEKWNLYTNNTDSFYVEATVDSIVYEPFMTNLLSDSIKIISFKKKDFSALCQFEWVT